MKNWSGLWITDLSRQPTDGLCMRNRVSDCGALMMSVSTSEKGLLGREAGPDMCKRLL